MTSLNAFELTLPIEDPILKFLLFIAIILFAPLLLDRLRIPHILGLIIAGAVIGPYGLNLVLRDSGVIMSGTTGLLYIMFLAGLEMDLREFMNHRRKCLYFGLITFALPMLAGVLTGIYILNFPFATSLLLGAMLASHTLIAYPVITRFGIRNNRAVTITVGGTMLTDTLALLVLAAVVGMARGTANAAFWIRLTVSIVIFGSIVLFLFPIIAKFFLRRCKDQLSRYLFVLMMILLGSYLAELAGIEGIIGATLTGLALNRLIPNTSQLMKRIDFVGNAIFIPFFLISVGMLIDYRVIFSDFNTILTAAIMTIVATASKFISALCSQKIFGYTNDERTVIFGLSNARAAATLATVMVGYNVIIGQNPDGTAIRLLNDTILNGTIIMIFFTCTIASFTAYKGAKNLSGQAEEVKDGNKR